MPAPSLVPIGHFLAVYSEEMWAMYGYDQALNEWRVTGDPDEFVPLFSDAMERAAKKREGMPPVSWAHFVFDTAARSLPGLKRLVMPELEDSEDENGDQRVH